MVRILCGRLHQHSRSELAPKAQGPLGRPRWAFALSGLGQRLWAFLPGCRGTHHGDEVPRPGHHFDPRMAPSGLSFSESSGLPPPRPGDERRGGARSYAGGSGGSSRPDWSSCDKATAGPWRPRCLPAGSSVMAWPSRPSYDFRRGIWPENVSLNGYAGESYGAAGGTLIASPSASWL